MIKRVGKFGEFWGCPSFPKCKGSLSTDEELNRRYGKIEHIHGWGVVFKG
jgi:ssDNA-binding Zn-finger/Zn-ribbon topoisomerase 1